MRLPKVFWILPFLSVLYAAAAHAEPAEPRNALVVGVASGTGSGALEAVLQQSGFSVTRLENPSLDSLYDALARYTEVLKGGGVGLLYFTGPSRRQEQRVLLMNKVQAQAGAGLDFAVLLETLASADNRLNIVVVDACTISGAATMPRLEIPAGFAVAWSGAICTENSKSLYTRHFLEVLTVPGLKLDELLRQVHEAVVKDSGGRQVPHEELALIGEFRFHAQGGEPQVALAEVSADEIRSLFNRASGGDPAALQDVQRHAVAGNALAQTSLANLYLAGLGVAQSYSEAAKWYRKAAEQGNANAQYLLGSMYENGQGVAQNRDEAVAWYRKAAEQGVGEARKALTRIGQ